MSVRADGVEDGDGDRLPRGSVRQAGSVEAKAGLV